MSDFAAALEPYSELANGVRRMLAPNPSMMTGPGTNTYLFGTREIAVLDPGPHLAAHLEAIVARAAAPIRWILATHTHPDHSPGIAYLAKMTGAEVLGMPAPAGENQDQSFKPNRELVHGGRLKTAEFELEAVHTPGHASNHLCYRLVANNWIFTGDHIIDGSTVVINPPDGNMSEYLRSLSLVQALRPRTLAPGHGDLIKDPDRLINWIIGHRLQREAKVLAAVGRKPGLTSHELVPDVYADVPIHLYAWAERSLFAHLLKLCDEGRVRVDEERWRAL
jgi:glyoxylase-like metal-dependent hydrolase (beta-lactamase superfamily II)